MFSLAGSVKTEGETSAPANPPASSPHLHLARVLAQYDLLWVVYLEGLQNVLTTPDYAVGLLLFVAMF